MIALLTPGFLKGVSHTPSHLISMLARRAGFAIRCGRLTRPAIED
jgi:hypothetical protein